MAIINGTGGNDTIRPPELGGSLGGLPDATADADTINGLGGDDFLAGGGGSDTIDGGDGRDVLHGGDGNDVLRMGAGTASGSEMAFGDAGNDDLTGTPSPSFLNFLFGGAGNDTIRGLSSAANEADYADRALDVVADLGAGTAVVGGSEADTLVEVRGIRTGAGNDRITGTDFNDNIFPGLGNNIVDGGAGTGDLLRYGDIPGSVVVDLAAGTAIKSADGSTDTLSGIENVQGTNGDDTIRGDAGDNEFRPLAGADLVDGRGGYDTVNYNSFFSGGPDIFSTAGDFPITTGVTVNLTAGTATDPWGNADTLAGIEAVIGTGFADDLTGIAIADGSRSQLRGEGGNDTPRGTGTDRSITASYTSDPARVLVNLSAGDETLAGTLVAAHTARDGFGGTDTIFSIQSVRGSAFNDIFVGSDLADRLEGEGGNDEIHARGGNDQVRGNAGNDKLFGEDGDDSLRGGAGGDQYSGGAGYDNLRFDDDAPTQGAVASLTTGAIVDSFGNVESIGTTNDFEMLVGSSLADDLEGKALPADIVFLEGKQGADTLRAGSGSSTDVVAYYAFDPAAITADLRLASGQVTDGYGDKDTLVGVGSVRGSRFDDLITGNDADNWFRGEGGNDTIDGQGGFDQLSYSSFASNVTQLSGITATLANGAGTVIDGLGGTDTVSNIEQINGSQLADTITISGSQGMRIFGNDGDDVIRGGDGDDDISGDAGADTVDAGGGSDTLRDVSGHINGVGALDHFTGGAGSDTFVIDSSVASGFAVADIVTDFQAGAGGDVVDLGSVLTYLQGTGEIAAGQNPFATGNLRVVAGSAVVQVDWDGADGPQGWVDLVILQGTMPGALVAENFDGLDPMAGQGPTSVPIPPGFQFSNHSTARGVTPVGPTTTDGVATSISAGTFLVEATGTWNSLKNVFTGADAYSAALGQDITVANFVDARLDLSNAGNLDLTVAAIGLKRGGIETAAGDDDITLVMHSNERGWGNTVKVVTDGGDDVVHATVVGLSALDDALLGDNANPANGPLWNPAYDGRYSIVEANLGDGDDIIVGAGVALVARGGAGSDTLVGGDGMRGDVLDGGAGSDIYTGGLGWDQFILRAGEADGDVITDFAGVGSTRGDVVRLLGFGAGASVVETAPGNYAIQEGGGTVGTFHAASGLVVGQDVFFV